MPGASYAIGSFLGGELSQVAQGRFDKPDYRTSLKVCINSFPIEIGAWTRRPGTRFAGTTRGGAPGRVVEFDFEQAAPVTLEFTDGFLRARSGANLVTTNDAQPIVAISAANPAVVQIITATNWPDRATGVILDLIANTPLLDNRQFLLTPIDGTHYALNDAITGGPIDGATLGPFVPGSAVLARVHELTTPYTNGAWAPIRAVQAETTDILLAPTVAPQALTVTTLPSANVNPAFALNPAVFNDGPYLDPFTNGVQATPGGKSGIVTITLAFPAYDSAKAYPAGAFVTSSSVNYVSLLDQNVGHTPSGLAPWWAATAAGAAINNGQGFLGTDAGRLVRLFSEPQLWLVGATYIVGNTVTYNPTGQPGASTYWQSLTAGNVGHAPGSDLTNWQLLPQGAAIWTWGKIVSLSNIIDRSLAGSASIGNMVSGGGDSAVFDGVFSKPLANSAWLQITGAGNFGPPTQFTLKTYVGKNYSGASDQVIQQAAVYPSSDFGFAVGEASGLMDIVSLTFNLYGSASVPPAGGTLLGTSGPLTDVNAAATIISSDQLTAWKYVWIEQITVAQVGGSVFVNSYKLNNAISQLSLFKPTGSGAVAAGVDIEILGPPLLYTTPILTWRLGVYSGTTGWPTCGVYHDGRLYLGGAVANRFDACVANGIAGGAINFAPTDQYGAVATNAAISYTFNANGVNLILWMEPDLQGIKMGTQAGEWLVKAPTTGSIAPNNITASNVTNHGSANIQPCRTEHTTIFVQRHGRKLLEYFPDVFSGKFSAPNLADKTARTRAGVAELAYTSATNPIIWGRCTDGSWFGITYKRDSLASAQPPTFYGWHGHTLGSGRVVESICAGASVGGNLDAVTMVTNDPATGLRHVEVMTDAGDEGNGLAEVWFLDDAVAAGSVSSTINGGAYGNGALTINGLWHLNGKTVQVFAAGLDCGDPGEGKPFADFTVANGSITIPYGDGISVGPGRGLLTAAFVASASPSQIVVGFTYDSDAQVVRPVTPADSGARNGPALFKLSRGHRFGMKLVNTFGLLVGGDLAKKLYPAKFTKADGVTPIAGPTTFSGVVQDALQDDYGYEGGSPAWRVSRPFPATVVIVGSNLATQDQ